MMQEIPCSIAMAPPTALVIVAAYVTLSATLSKSTIAHIGWALVHRLITPPWIALLVDTTLACGRHVDATLACGRYATML